MKKYLLNMICTICLVMTMIFLPNYKVNAFTGNDSKEYPDKPEDGYTDYIVYYRKDVDAKYLISFNKLEGIYVTTGYYLSNGPDLNIYSYVVCKDPYKLNENAGICKHDISTSFTNYKFYWLENNQWNLFEDEEERKASFSNVTVLLYSTVDIYYRNDGSKSTYPEDSYYIPGEHYVERTLTGLDSSYADKTYSRNLGKFSYWINDITGSFDGDSSYTYDTHSLMVDVSNLWDDSDNNAKYQFSYNKTKWYDIPFTEEYKKLTIYTPFFMDCYLQKIVDGKVQVETTIPKESFYNNNISYEPSINMAYNPDTKFDNVLYKFDYRRLFNANGKPIHGYIEPSEIDDSQKIEFTYTLNGVQITEPVYTLELNSENWKDYPKLDIKLCVDGIPIYEKTFGLSDDYISFNDYYDKIYKDYMDNLDEIKNNDNFFTGLSNAFDYFSGKISNILSNIDYFFKSLPMELRYFYYSIFGLSLFFIFVRYIL